MSLSGAPSTDVSNTSNVFVQFNQNSTSLVAGSSSGHHLFALTAEDGVEEVHASRSGDETCIVERLFNSSLVALVTLAAPRKLIVYHYKKGAEICNYSYSNTILAVRLNRLRLVVCLEDSLHIHNIRDMKVLHTIRETPSNPRGLLALTASSERCLLAYPGSARSGEVQVFDAVHLTASCALAAHEAPLAALAFSACGRRLATASERGTVIRVFSVPERQRLFEFRRGMKRCVSISSLAFSADAAMLAAASNTETLHVFRLSGEEAPAEEPPADASWGSWIASAVAAGATLLPAQMGAVLSQGRAFAYARLPHPCNRVVVTISNVGKEPRLLAATSGGMLYVYALDESEGGECPLLRQHNLLQVDAPPAPPPAAAGTSYASALSGRDPNVMTESMREGELSRAVEGSPPRGELDLQDERHFPPMRAAH